MITLDPAILSVILYLTNLSTSGIIAIIIINNLYISKKFSKENDFHLYNDLFSWEMFFILIGIANFLTILSTLIPLSTEIFKLFFNIKFFLLFNAFWNKIIHLERVMDKITYERHFIPGVIPCILFILILFIELPYFILLFIFFSSALIPYLILIIILKNTGTFKLKTVKILIGTVFIGFGYGLTLEIINLTSIKVPILFLIGSLIIIDSFRKELFLNKR